MKKLAFLCACIVFFSCTMSVLSSSAAVAEDLTLGGLVSEKTIEEMGHTQISDNLADQLNGVEYINEDGTRTAYLFAKPIKYKDENNEIKRIDNSLRREIFKKGWSNSANSFSLFVHEEISNGVELTYNDVILKATPVLSQVTASGKQSNASRISAYKVGRSDENIEIAYESTYTGYSMTVTIPGGSGASFAMDITGDASAVTAENGQVTVSMKDGSAVVYTLQAAFVGDEYLWLDDVEVNVAQMKRENARTEYTVNENVTADEITLQIGCEIISAANNNSRSSSSTDIFVESMVYSGQVNRYFIIGSSFLVGSQGTNKDYRSFVYMDISPLSNIPYNRILGANYRVYELTNTETSFQAEAYMVTENWRQGSVGGITWSSMPTYNDEKITTVSVSYYHDEAWYDFYITRAVMAWLQGIPNHGIMLKSRTEGTNNYRRFASGQNSSYMPCLKVTYTNDTTSMDNIGIEDNDEYYIKNKNSMKYLTASGNTSSSNVVQSDWTGNDNQKWTVTYEGDGYYKLSPANATNMVLDTSGGNNTNGANIQLYSPNTGLGQRFKFIRNWDGSYQIVTCLSNDVRGLKVENNSETSGSNVYHWYHNVDWAKSDDWTLEPVDKGFASLYCFTEEDGDGYDLDTYQFSEDILEPLINMDYSACLFVDEPAATAYDLMPDDSIFVFCGHGEYGGIQFKSDYNATTPDRITAGGTSSYAISAMPHNALANLKLALYSSCFAGKDDAATNTNMVGATYYRGAHLAIAHPVTVTSPCVFWWVIEFLSACSDGEPVYRAMDIADEHLYANVDGDYLYGNAFQRHMLGDYSMQLYHADGSEE